MKAQELYLCFHTGTPSISSYSKANAVLPLNSLHYWYVQQISLLRDLGQRTSTILQSPGGLVRLQKSMPSYWQGSEYFKMFSSYGTFPVFRFEGIPAFCPFFQMTLKIPDSEFCGISAYITTCLFSFNDYHLCFQRLHFKPFLSQSPTGSFHDVI